MLPLYKVIFICLGFIDSKKIQSYINNLTYLNRWSKREQAVGGLLLWEFRASCDR